MWKMSQLHCSGIYFGPPVSRPGVSLLLAFFLSTPLLTTLLPDKNQHLAEVLMSSLLPGSCHFCLNFWLHFCLRWTWVWLLSFGFMTFDSDFFPFPTAGSHHIVSFFPLLIPYRPLSFYHCKIGCGSELCWQWWGLRDLEFKLHILRVWSGQDI